MTEEEITAKVQQEIREKLLNELATKKKAEEEITTKVQQEVREKLLKELDAKRKAEEVARIKAKEEAKRKVEEEAKRKAEEEARLKAEEEERRKAEEEARHKAEEEARRKAEEEDARRKAEKKAKVDALIEKANTGDINAIKELANDYYLNDSEYKNYELAFHWFSRGAELGDVSCMVSLGQFCYYQGNGIEQNTQLAIHWLTKASNAGSAVAMNKLAHIYSDDGRAKDLKMAYSLFKQSAELGYYNSMSNLGGFCYLHGNGIEKDPYYALFWLQKCILEDSSDEWAVERYKTAYQAVQQGREYIQQLVKQLREGKADGLFDKPIYVLSNKQWAGYSEIYNKMK